MQDFLRLCDDAFDVIGNLVKDSSIRLRVHACAQLGKMKGVQLR